MTPDLEQFIQAHLHCKPYEMALLAQRYPHIDMPYAIDQVAGRSMAAKKLPSWAKTQGMVYPPKVSMEQCSSEATGIFKASLFAGKRVADLSGGLGVDAYFLSKNFEEVHHVEMDEALSNIARHNFKQLEAHNIACHAQTAEDFLKESTGTFDLLYLDPARRDGLQRRLVSLDDCSPNVLEMRELLLEKAPNVLIKASPLIDLKQTKQEVPNLAHIWVVAVDGECKEVLLQLSRNEVADVGIAAINMTKNGIHSFEGSFDGELQAHAQLSMPQKYLYEPHAALMKSGLYKTLAQAWNMPKLHPHSHLYTSDQLFPDFPGRKFAVKEVFDFQSKLFKGKNTLPKKANLAVRNFPLTVEELRKKSKIADGGTDYLFATTDMRNEQIIIVCEAERV